LVATDAPDWQRVVTVQSGGTLTDAPDWERVVTGPGGGTVVGTAVLLAYASTSYHFPWTLPANGLFGNVVQLASSVAIPSGGLLLAGVNLANVTLTGTTATATLVGSLQIGPFPTDAENAADWADTLYPVSSSGYCGINISWPVFAIPGPGQAVILRALAKSSSGTGTVNFGPTQTGNIGSSQAYLYWLPG
jgi:hypothetical protein